MSISARQTLTILVTLALVVSGTAGLAGATTNQATADQEAADQTTLDSECAATPPDDQSDPSSDTIGWENGTWYDESLDVDQSDGVNRTEQRRIVDRTTARVEALRCVEFEESVDVSVVSRAGYLDRLEAGDLTADVTPELRTFDNAKFEALFLVNQSADSIRVQQENLGTAVLGFYSPETGEIVLIADDREALRIDEVTLGHELMHAWQDQEHDLSSEELAPRVRDEANARNGLVEGDASYVDSLYERQCEEGTWNGTCLQPGARQPGEGGLSNMGLYFLEYQPYADGPEFVRLARTVGDWDAVDALYDRPPASTEQVIHVEKYGHDQPTEPNLTDRTSDDWDRVTVPDRPDYGSVGEAGLMSMLIYPFYHSEGTEQVIPPTEWLNFDEDGNASEFDPVDYRSNFSEGWDGDRLHVYEANESNAANETDEVTETSEADQTNWTGETNATDETGETNAANETAYVWRLEWDSPQDAGEFVLGYQRVLEYWGAEQVGPGTYRIADGDFAGAYHVGVDDTTVTIVNAPSVDQLDEVRTDITTGAMPGNEPGPGNGPAAGDETTADNGTVADDGAASE